MPRPDPPDPSTTDEAVRVLRAVSDFRRDVRSRADREGRVAIAHVEIVGCDAHALDRVTAAIAAHVRPQDTTVQLGADELLCVMPGLRLDEVRARFGAIERALGGDQPAQRINVGFAVVAREDADALLEGPS